MAALADLGTYPSWLSLVAAAEPEASRSAPGAAPTPSAAVTHPRDATEAANHPAWSVTLRARLGPLARSKRLRMVRTSLDESTVRFERVELDGRQHAEWKLSAELEPTAAGGSEVHVHLHYGGALWSAPLEIVLASFEGTAADRLSAYLANPHR